MQSVHHHLHHLITTCFYKFTLYYVLLKTFKKEFTHIIFILVNIVEFLWVGVRYQFLRNLPTDFDETLHANTKDDAGPKNFRFHEFFFFDFYSFCDRSEQPGRHRPRIVCAYSVNCRDYCVFLSGLHVYWRE